MVLSLRSSALSVMVIGRWSDFIAVFTFQFSCVMRSLEEKVMSGDVDDVPVTLVGKSSFMIPKGKSEMVSTIILPLVSSVASVSQWS